MEKEDSEKITENLSQLTEQGYPLDHITRLVENEKLGVDDMGLNCALFHNRADVVALLIKYRPQLQSSAENPFLHQHVDTNSILLLKSKKKNKRSFLVRLIRLKAKIENPKELYQVLKIL